MNTVAIILAIMLFPIAALSIAILVNSYDKFNFGSISDWLTLLTTISFGIYAIIQWRKPKIDNDIYEIEKKIVVFDYAEIYSVVEKETSLINSQYFYFQIINGIFTIQINPATASKRIFDADIMFQKKTDTEALQNIAKKIDEDLLILKKLGRDFTNEMSKLHEDYNKLCRNHFLKVSMLWGDLHNYSNSQAKKALSQLQISDLHKKHKGINQSWDDIKIKKDEIYNYSEGFNKYFTRHSK